jgi:hypothetical protein
MPLQTATGFTYFIHGSAIQEKSIYLKIYGKLKIYQGIFGTLKHSRDTRSQPL